MFCNRGSRPRLSASLVLVTLLCACAKHQEQPQQPAAAQVPVVAADVGKVSPSSTLGGIIVPYQNVQIQSNLTEPVDAVYVNEGDRVKRGQVLARLDIADLQANLKSDLGTAASDAAKAAQTFDQADLTIVQNDNTVNAARAAVRQAQATLAADTLNLQRDAALLQSGYVAQQTYDSQKTLVQNDGQALASAQVAVANDIKQVQANGTTSTGLQGATVAAARADEQTALGQADNVRAAIAKATIVSPIDGVVVNRNLNPGEYPGSRQIFTLQETDNVYAVLSGSGSQVVGVRNGSPTEIHSTDHANLKASGHVVGVLDEVTPGSTNFVVKVLVPNTNGSFHSGMVVSGRVTRPSTTGVRIPVTAFLDTTNSTVQIIDNGAAKTVNVTMIADDGKNAIVTGLRTGQEIIANGQLGLPDGQPVEPQKAAVAER
jgi:multidrug efflux pump subunit AcrA (membrane-fusion protein)